MSAVGGLVVMFVVPVINIVLWFVIAISQNRPRAYLYKCIPILFTISTVLLAFGCLSSGKWDGRWSFCFSNRIMILFHLGIGAIASFLLASAEAVFGRTKRLSEWLAVAAMMASALWMLLLHFILSESG